MNVTLRRSVILLALALVLLIGLIGWTMRMTMATPVHSSPALQTSHVLADGGPWLDLSAATLWLLGVVGVFSRGGSGCGCGVGALAPPASHCVESSENRVNLYGNAGGASAPTPHPHPLPPLRVSRLTS